MSIRVDFMQDIYDLLFSRYTMMAENTASKDKVTAMMTQVAKNCSIWPDDKTGRWVGYVQCILIEVEKVTTIEEERNFTRPLFHHLYQISGIRIPESVDISL